MKGKGGLGMRAGLDERERRAGRERGPGFEAIHCLYRRCTVKDCIHYCAPHLTTSPGSHTGLEVM